MNDIEGRQFVDTNILIYAHDSSAGHKHRAACELVSTLWKTGRGCLSTQVLQEFYVNVTQKVPHPLASSEAAQIIADLAAWQVHCPNIDDVLHALRVQDRHRISFWDAMIIASAVQLGCTTLWSEDLSAGKVYDQLTVLRPF
jgi:predicted nucleic acid-binding protein